MRILLQHDRADVNQCDGDGQSSLDIALFGQSNMSRRFAYAQIVVVMLSEAAVSARTIPIGFLILVGLDMPTIGP